MAIWEAPKQWATAWRLSHMAADAQRTLAHQGGGVYLSEHGASALSPYGYHELVYGWLIHQPLSAPVDKEREAHTATALYLTLNQQRRFMYVEGTTEPQSQIVRAVGLTALQVVQLGREVVSEVERNIQQLAPHQISAENTPD